MLLIVTGYAPQGKQSQLSRYQKSGRRSRSSGYHRSRSTEAQLTRAFSRVVAERPVLAAVILAVVVLALGAWLLLRPSSGSGESAHPGTSHAASSNSASKGSIGQIKESSLPKEARDVLAAIRSGGPFAYEEDGSVFSNYEGALPKKKSGYYHEYTVKMPGDTTRGAHRLVTGEGGEIYWSADHYATFAVVQEGA